MSESIRSSKRLNFGLLFSFPRHSSVIECCFDVTDRWREGSFSRSPEVAAAVVGDIGAETNRWEVRMRREREDVVIVMVWIVTVPLMMTKCG